MNNDRVNRRWTPPPDEVKYNKPRKARRRMVAGTIIALVLLAGVTWFAYPRLKPYGAAFSQFPGVKQTASAVGEKMNALESRWRSWLDENRHYRERLQKMMARRDSGVDARLANLESQSNTEQVRLAGLQDEVKALRTDSSTYASQLAQQLSQMEQTTQRNFDGVNQQLTGASGDVREGMQMDRIKFEAAFNSDTYLAPGITVFLTGADTDKRKVDGWVWLPSDQKTVWLQGQTAGQPTVFYSKEDGKRRELVFTGVTKTGAEGYLLVPSDPDPSSTASDE